jgi:4-hydroxy-tetrahydrodipicolinate synthase
MNLLPVDANTRAVLSRGEKLQTLQPADAEKVAHFKKHISGPMLPVLTHYKDDDSLDFNALKVNIDHVIEQGFANGNGCLLGAAAGGDFSLLNLEERKAVITELVKIVDKRCFLGVSVQGTDARLLVELAKHAEQAGADFIQVSPMYYYESSFEDFDRILQAIVDATDSIPLMVYNTPWEGFDLTVDNLITLCNKYDRFVALKWATEDQTKYLKVIDLLKDRLAIVDNHGLHVLSYMLGATGFISHYSNVDPAYDLKTHQLLKDGEYTEALNRLKTVNWPWRDFRIKMWNRSALESPVVKRALEIKGRIGGPVRLPSRLLTEEETQELTELFQSFKA